MAILRKHSVDSAHWYAGDGQPVHEVPRSEEKDGETMRPTNLGDARKLGLYPSVTSILGLFDKPQLTKWKCKQVANAALLVTRDPNETESYWHGRVFDHAFQQVDDAADHGTSMHKMLDQMLETNNLLHVAPEFMAYMQPAYDWFASKKLRVISREEVVVNHEHGFAGTLDLYGAFGSNPDENKQGYFVLDYKTRKTKPGVEVKPYEHQPWQIAAYARTKNPQAFDEGRMWGLNFFLSSTEPGRIETVRYEPKLLQEAYVCFALACHIWRHLNDYDPRPNKSTIVFNSQIAAEEKLKPTPTMKNDPAINSALETFDKKNGKGKAKATPKKEAPSPELTTSEAPADDIEAILAKNRAAAKKKAPTKKVGKPKKSPPKGKS